MCWFMQIMSNKKTFASFSSVSFECSISLRCNTNDKFCMEGLAFQFQEEISLLFDYFLESMRYSCAKVVVTSIRHDVNCTVTLTLWRCRYCRECDKVFKTYMTIEKWSDVRCLGLYLDHIKTVWRFYHPMDCLTV